MLGKVGGNFAAETAGKGIFVQNQYPAGFFGALLHGFLVPGLQAAQVDDLDGLTGVFGSVLYGPVHAEAVGDDAGERTLLYGFCLAYLYIIIAIGHFTAG